MVHDGDKIIEK